MRHNKKFNHLGRKSAHRKAMLANMACSLILHKRISTTVAKAKALKIYVEPLITKSKEDITHNRRTVFSYLKSKTAVTELFRDVAVKIADRPGGYTRILKTGNRIGDNAEMCIIELVDFNEAMLAGKEEKKGTSRRRRSTSKKKDAPAAETTTKAPKAEKVAPVVEDAVVVEEPVVEKAEEVVEQTPESTEDTKE
jgi:large subunit ribosomal protein L17